MIWRLLDAVLSRLVGRLLRLSPVDPQRPMAGRELRRWRRDLRRQERHDAKLYAALDIQGPSTIRRKS